MSFRHLHVALVLVAVVAALSSGVRPLLAQGRNWSQPYENGLDDIKKQKWTDAIADLTKAIAVDPKAQANKHIEGTYYQDYFPYYYRGLAYMQAGNPSKAEEDFQAALKTRMPDDLAQDLKRREAQVQATLGPTATKPPVSATQAPPTQPEPVKPEPAKSPATDPRAQAATLVKDGNALLAQGKLSQAQTDFQDAVKLAAQTPGAQDGISAIATRRSQYDNAKRAAATARQNGQTNDAIASFQKAKAADPEQYAADQLDVQLQATTREGATQRLAKSANALNAGRELARQHQYAAAQTKYQEAVDADATNAPAADALRRSQTYDTRVADGRSMFTQGNWLGARVQFADAQSLDGDRFKAEGLDAMVADIGRRLAPTTKPPAAPAGAAPGPAVPAPTAVKPPLHDALVAYLDGQISHAIDLLQPLASADAGYDGVGRASIHAYLGVAYATNALEARADDARANWRGKAIKEFQAADAAQPGFQLSQRVVSPAIQAIVDESRRR